MNQSLQPGGNTILTSFDGTVTVMHSISTNSDIDLTAFLLTDKNKVQGDSGIIFYNQPKGQNGVATYFPAQDNQSIRTHRIDFDLSKMPQGISRIAVTLTEAGNSSFGNVENLKAMVQSGDIVYELNPAQLSIEKGIVVLEIYLRGKEPKLRSSWQGFSSGLDGLCEYFGVEVSDEPVAVPPKLTSYMNEIGVVENMPETVNLIPDEIRQSNHVSLEKVSGKVNLSKGQKPIIIKKTPEITASVSWHSGTDYDIYALVLTNNGVQVDVAMFGAKGIAPLKSYNNGAVEHMGDVGRSNGLSNLEVIKIRLNDDILAVVPVVYSAQSNGSGSFSRYKVSMAIDNNNGTTITIPTENANKNDRIYTCIPGLILNTADGIIIEAVEKYSKPGSENRPKLKLNAEGSVEILMDAGPKNNYK